MDLPVNHNEPLVMHIDLNSCFASVEQQANRLLRGRPLVVAAYKAPNGCVLSPSIEAKQLGIKVGMSVRDAKLICKDIVVLTPDVQKVFAVHSRLMQVFRLFTDDVVPKSIDEAALNFDRCQAVIKRPLAEIAQEIKYRLRQDVGDWLRCNIGLGTNRFLAKVGAGLHKPDGFDIIDHRNLKDIYASLVLVDLPGINTRFEARLNTCGIFTPLEFFGASWDTLKRQVFHSSEGHRWHLRLRGWEVDAVNFSRKSFGHSYALPKPTADPKDLSRLIMKLSEKVGRRLRRAVQLAYGIHVACLYTDHSHWHTGCRHHQPMYATQEIYLQAQRLLNAQPTRKPVANLAISCFGLGRARPEQVALFDTDRAKNKRLADAADDLNDRYGEFMVTPAIMMAMEQEAVNRISFGNIANLMY